MSSEPEKDIEKQIRSYADRRREETGEPFTMRPVARLTLQGQVAEAYPRKKAEPTPITVLQANEAIGFWTLFRRQLTMFGSLAVVLLAVGVIWVKYGAATKTDLAQADTNPTSPDVGEGGGEPLEMVDLGVQSDPEPIHSTASSPAPSMVRVPAPTPTTVASASVTPAPAPAVSEMTAPPAAPVAPTPVLAADSPPAMTSDPNRPAQRFVADSSGKTMRRNFNSPPSVEILRSFQVQQVGRQLLLVDADGSTYAGEIAAPNGDGGPLTFRARGTSRSLNQSVTIEGRLSLVRPGAAPSATTAPLRVSNEATLPLNQLRIQGRATVGANNQVPFNALPSE
jgi:hypothetical protein